MGLTSGVSQEWMPCSSVSRVLVCRIVLGFSVRWPECEDYRILRKAQEKSKAHGVTNGNIQQPLHLGFAARMLVAFLACALHADGPGAGVLRHIAKVWSFKKEVSYHV